MAIEAVGIPATFDVCQSILAAGGRLANIGVHGKPVQLHLEKLWDRNIAITTRLVDTAAIPMLLKLVGSGKLQPAQLVTHQRAALAGGCVTLSQIAPAFAWSDTTTAATQARPDANVIDLVIADLALPINGRTGNAMAVNGTVPGPLVRLREGQEAVIRVTNRLEEIASIHWHGILLPPDMDGVPGVSFGGIKAGETFTYRFPVVQSGTYWAHSHSGGQELLGVYFPLIIAHGPLDGLEVRGSFICRHEKTGWI